MHIYLSNKRKVTSTPWTRSTERMTVDNKLFNNSKLPMADYLSQTKVCGLYQRPYFTLKLIRTQITSVEFSRILVSGKIHGCLTLVFSAAMTNHILTLWHSLVKYAVKILVCLRIRFIIFPYRLVNSEIAPSNINQSS